MDESVIDVLRVARAAPIDADELHILQRRSDARGLARFVGHWLAVAGTGACYVLAIEWHAPVPLTALAALALGFGFVTMFAMMHESVHRTAFKTRWLNDAVGWLAGLFSFYNSSFYRPYHGWHHRFTQLTGRDPELEDPKPTTRLGYFIELSGVPWWMGKIRTHLKLAAGKTAGYGFLNAQNTRSVVRSVRAQLAVYAAAIAASLWLGYPYFIVYWLAPVALAQPLLRAILLAEHMGCSEDADMLSNTRTTYTLWPVRFLMWEMPYHADHHRYPAVPFFALSRTHVHLEPYLGHIARRGYSGLHLEIFKALGLRKSEPLNVEGEPRPGGS